MKIVVGKVLSGPAGTATELNWKRERRDPPDWTATLAGWFLNCPGQSPAWEHYLLSIIHLRPIEGVKPAVVNVPGATHEILMVALDPGKNPKPEDSYSWSFLRPTNLMEQVQLPDDESAVDLLHDCVVAVLDGRLWAEPMLSGQVEPWRTVLVKAAAHIRGEEHAP